MSIPDDASYGVVSIDNSPQTQLWRPDSAGYQSLQGYLIATGAPEAGQYQLSGSAVVSADGTEIGGSATDAQGKSWAYIARVDIPKPALPQLISMRVAPRPRVGGNPVSITAHISGSAPSGGTKLIVSTTTTNISPHPTALVGGPGIFIPDGAAAGVEYADTSPVPGDNATFVRVTCGGLSIFEPVILKGANIYNPSLSPPVVVGGATVKCTVKLNGPAFNDDYITVLSSDAIASVPAFVKIAKGSLSTTFDVQTMTVAKQKTVTISTFYFSSWKSSKLIVTP